MTHAAHVYIYGNSHYRVYSIRFVLSLFVENTVQYMYKVMYIIRNNYICDRVCEKSTKYTYSFYHISLFFCVGYTVSVSFIEFLRKFCVAI